MYSRGQQDKPSRLGEVKADALHSAEGSSPGSAMVMESGHHRGLRAGHAFTGATRELGRAVCLLSMTEAEDKGYRVNKSPGAERAALRPPASRKRDTNQEWAGKVSGSERQAKRPEKGMAAVLAEHSTEGRGSKCPSGKVGN